MVKRIPEEIIDNVRSQTNIVNVVEQYVQLKKTGKNHSGLCPFHDEKTPSFTVNEQKQIFYCFGCGKGGNVFKFLQEIEGISFPEAVLRTAEMAHLNIDEQLQSSVRQTIRQPDNHQSKLIGLHEKAAELYHHILLHTKAGEPALAYLKERGLTDELIETFQIGFAPKERIFLQQIFQQEEISDELLADSGLLVQKENGEWLDRFYQRIMFPICNQQGKIVAFSGRTLPTNEPDERKQAKYLNSPETIIFNKRLVLFNFDKARSSIRKADEVVLFEGFMDVIAAWKAGVRNGIASMGTSLTNEQVQMLQKTAKSVLLCYDGDDAGVEATNRGVQLLAETNHFDLSILTLPEKLDPDEFIKTYGSTEFCNLIQHGRQTVFSFKMYYYKRGRNLANEKERLEYIERILQELARLPSIVERELYVNQLAEEFHLSVESLGKQLQSFKQLEQQKRQQVSRARTKQFDNGAPERITRIERQVRTLSQVEKAERQLLYRVINEQRIAHRIRQEDGFAFVHDIYQELYMLHEAYTAEHTHFESADFLDFLQDERLRRQAAEIMCLEFDEECTEQEVDDCVKVVKESRHVELIQHKRQERDEAKRCGNKALEDQLSIEIVQLQQLLKNP